MKRVMGSSTVLSAVALLVSSVCATPMPAQVPANATVFATGLQGPRGMVFGTDGILYVAEAGLGGTTSTVGTCPQVPGPIGPYTGGATGRISKVNSTGRRTTFSSGLPSTVDAQGDVMGVADLAFLDSKLYALVAGGGCSHGNRSTPNQIAEINMKSGQWSTLVDLSAALKRFRAKYTSSDDYEPDGSWYGMIAYGGNLIADEPNHGQLFTATTGGEIRQLIDISSSQGHIVPTSLVNMNDVFYVGNLNLFPIDPQWAKVMTIAKELLVPNPLPGFDLSDLSYNKWKVVSSKAGFTTITSLKVGPDGLLYVLELSDAPGYPTPGQGKVIRVKSNGDLQTVVSGLTVPTGMAFGPDGRLYVANFGAAPGASGQILRVDLPPVD